MKTFAALSLLAVFASALNLRSSTLSQQRVEDVVEEVVEDQTQTAATLQKITLDVVKHLSATKEECEKLVDDILIPGTYYLIDYYSWIDAVPELVSKEESDLIVT
jgi:hypothetical protein